MSETLTPITREEQFLDAIADAVGGGGGGTSDYDDLTNKPSINGVTLSGNKTSSQLGIEGLPAVTEDYEGSYLVVDGNGEWTINSDGIPYVYSIDVNSGDYSQIGTDIITAFTTFITNAVTYMTTNSVDRCISGANNNNTSSANLYGQFIDIALMNYGFTRRPVAVSTPLGAFFVVGASSNSIMFNANGVYTIPNQMSIGFNVGVNIDNGGGIYINGNVMM